MDDEPIWATNRVVALIPGSAITILETANEFAIKESAICLNIYIENEAVRQMMLPLSLTGEKTKSTPKKTIAFAAEGNSSSDTNKIMAQMDAMIIKMDAQYKELQSRAKQPTPDLDDDDIPMSREEEAKFMQTFSDLGASINLMLYSLYAKLSLKTLKPTKMSVRLADRSFQYPVEIAKNMLVEVGKFTFLSDFVILEMDEDSKVILILGRPFLLTAKAVIRVKQKL
uniref:Reverse transcriptase domain-containing protein n=1 Tax=Tanacetum cinerariifolium TaxID=118510 RepID=A0A6L2M0Y3_TANCI|nr:reverse transcriptase domain-containing protein [Tanacetum cinerariifolium]